MPAPRVRADYDQLKQAASAFGQNSSSCQQTLQRLKSNMETLQGGDWIGQGATAFYKEMGDSVLPKLQRLINALNTAQNSLSKISTIMKDAEDQAANVLKGPGGSSSGPIGASFGAATGAGLGAAVGAAPAGPMGASSPASAQVAGKFAGATAGGASAAGGVKADAFTVKQKITEGPAGPQVASNTIGGAASSDWIKASGAAIPQGPANNIGFPQADASGKDAGKINVKGDQFSPMAGKIADGTSNTLGAQNLDAGSKDAIFEQGVKGSQLGGLANKGWERDNAQFSQTAGKVGDAAGNTIGGAASSDWIKASGAPGPQGPTNNIGFPQMDAASKDAAKMNLAGDQFNPKIDTNTIGGTASSDWIKASGAASPKIDSSALGANTIGGAAAKDDWAANLGPEASGQRQHLPTNFGTGLGGGGSTHNAFQAAASGANTAGGSGYIDKMNVDYAAGGAAPTGPGASMGKVGSEFGVGANTIGGAAAADLPIHTGEVGPVAGAPTPGVGNSPTRVSETFQGIEHTNNLAGGAASDDWDTGSSDPKDGDND